MVTGTLKSTQIFIGKMLFTYFKFHFGYSFKFGLCIELYIILLIISKRVRYIFEKRILLSVVKFGWSSNILHNNFKKLNKQLEKTVVMTFFLGEKK